MPGGRPTDYDPAYCQKIIDYFSVPAKTAEGKPTLFPTFQRFAHEIGVSMSTLSKWRDEIPEFSEAYAHAKGLQESIWLQNGMDGSYSAQFAKFFGINCFDGRYKDKQDVDIKADTSINFTISADASAGDLTG